MFRVYSVSVLSFLSSSYAFVVYFDNTPRQPFCFELRLDSDVYFPFLVHVTEFDKFLEGYKQDLSDKVVTQDLTEAEIDLQEIELDEADQEVGLLQLCSIFFLSYFLL